MANTIVWVNRGLRWVAVGAAGLAIASYAQISLADEGGVSFWLPGQFGSLAAVPQQPGWSFAEIFYHTSVSAGADVAAAREVTIGRFTPMVNANLSGSLNAAADLVLGNATYVFGTPVLGGQASVGMTGIFARSSADLAAMVTGTVGPFPFTRSDTINGAVTGFGDLYPMGQLRWNQGVNNYMVYATGDVPVGAYDSRRLANIGIGHYAVDSGVGYTYLNPQTGQEFSAVTGLTYNFVNPSTQYQNGSIGTSTWGCRNSSPSRFSSVWLATSTSRSQPTAAPATGRLPVARRRRRPADRCHLSVREHAGLPEFQGICGIRPAKPAGRLERLDHAFDLTRRAGAAIVAIDAGK